jgi:hypothetical protein
MSCIFSFFEKKSLSPYHQSSSMQRRERSDTFILRKEEQPIIDCGLLADSEIILPTHLDSHLVYLFIFHESKLQFSASLF